MTGIHYCKNCKHLGLDGMFGLICDVNGNNKNYDCPKYEEKGEGMTEKRKVTIVVEDDFGRVQTAIKTELSAPQIMDKILEDLE